MSNQPPLPSRPWLRLSSTTPPPPRAATPVLPVVGTPPLRPEITLPAFVRPTAPEPTQRPPPALAPPSATDLISDTKPSPKMIMPQAEKTPPHSPALKPVAPPPPSPLKLPPPQAKAPDKDTPRMPLEAEQKNMLIQKSVTLPERENGNRDTIRSVEPQEPSIAAAAVKEAKDAVKAAEAGKGNGIIAEKKVESGEKGMKVIMIAGKNKGASMELGCPAKNRHRRIGNHDTASLSVSVYTNSNVQGVNNSILYNSSCTLSDPGVHFSLTRKPAEQGVLPRMKDNKT